MSLTQLNPPLPIVTPRGPGLAHAVIDYGPEAHLLFMVFLDESKEIWSYASRECRAQTNISMNRPPVNDVLRDLPGRAVPLADYAKNVANMPEEVRPNVGCHAAGH